MTTRFLRAAVIGQPVAHSLSPLIHTYWLRRHNIPGSYEALEIAPDALGERLKTLIAADYNGFNVTIPHKQSVMEICEAIYSTGTEDWRGEYIACGS